MSVMSDRQLFNDFINKIISKSSSPFVRDSEKMIQYFLELERNTPSTQSWVYQKTENFQKKLKDGNKYSTAKDVNRLYWGDMIENIKAYNYMVTWRGSEIIHSSIESLNKGEIAPPAILVRSLLEISSLILVESNKIFSITNDILEKYPRNSNAIAASQDMEDIIVRLIHGTRYKKFNDRPQAINILTYIDKISKNENSTWLREVYDFLCEIAHPNIIGNARFWAKIESTNKDGTSIVRIDKNALHEGIEGILENILMSFGWASAVLRNGVEINNQSIKTIEDLFVK